MIRHNTHSFNSIYQNSSIAGELGDKITQISGPQQIPRITYAVDRTYIVKHWNLNSAIEQELRDRRVEDRANATSSA